MPQSTGLVRECPEGDTQTPTPVENVSGSATAVRTGYLCDCSGSERVQTHSIVSRQTDTGWETLYFPVAGGTPVTVAPLGLVVCTDSDLQTPLTKCYAEDIDFEYLGDGSAMDLAALRALADGKTIPGSNVTFSAANTLHVLFGYDFEVLLQGSEVSVNGAATTTTSSDATGEKLGQETNVDPTGHFADLGDEHSPREVADFLFTAAVGTGVKARICVGVCINRKTGQAVEAP